MQTAKQKIAKLRRRQLDELYQSLAPIHNLLPEGAWIKDVRSALGMSAAQMARLLDISKAALARLEKNEASRAITLKSIEKIATVMHCRLVYAIVPEAGFGSLDSILRERANIVAKQILEAASHTMALEDQTVPASKRKVQVDELAEELVRTMDKRLWEAI